MSKQYAIFFAPLIGFLIDPNWTRKDVLIFLAKTAAVGILVNLPFLIMGPIILFNALTAVTDPFRPDALSFLAATASAGKPTWPVWIQFPLLVPAYVLLYVRGPKGATGFALGSALVICVFFSFSRHAVQPSLPGIGFHGRRLGDEGSRSQRELRSTVGVRAVNGGKDVESLLAAYEAAGAFIEHPTNRVTGATPPASADPGGRPLGRCGDSRIEPKGRP